MGVPGKLIFAVACLFLADRFYCGEILVFPEDGSHWVNMMVILKQLHSNGHTLTVVRSARSLYIQERSSFYTSITINPSQMEDIGSGLFDALLIRSLELRTMSPLWRFIEQQKDITAILKTFHGVAHQMICTILEDTLLINRLHSAKFDMMLTDPAFPAGVLLANYLHLPLVYNVRWLNAGDAHMAIAPSPPSYVPTYNSLFHDRMGFIERAENLLRYLVIRFQENFVILPIYSNLLARYFPSDFDLLSMQQSADIWLLRVDFAFEFPRPTMPNIIYIGGFQCQPPQPLPADLESFMQSSGEHGVVVMSLGVMVAALPMEITEIIADAFAQIPQKVVWRYMGERPSTLGNNTLLVDWLPQNDLLGHPKTHAFVSHGGTNGIYEAIYHGVPVVGLPLMFDQFDNIHRLETRGAARLVEVATLTSEGFKEALLDILQNPSYRQSIQKLSRLHKDQPISPLNNAIFWIEYVIRNKGAGHLRSQAIGLPWYSYYCMDIFVFFLALAFTIVWTAFTFCRLICFRGSPKKKVE
ncbi:UDP-glucuronosyltransferase 2C1 [Denticeps clupeoides]|uniref:UDP-glucuronosyltransferase n=1 Tax=Denticeps clupeoides TaxID=299321 RepID=A0AAY4BL06_9TELE